MQHEFAFRLPPEDMRQAKKRVTRLERYKDGADSTATGVERKLPFQEADYERAAQEAKDSISLLDQVLATFIKHKPAPK